MLWSVKSSIGGKIDFPCVPLLGRRDLQPHPVLESQSPVNITARVLPVPFLYASDTVTKGALLRLITSSLYPFLQAFQNHLPRSYSYIYWKTGRTQTFTGHTVCSRNFAKASSLTARTGLLEKQYPCFTNQKREMQSLRNLSPVMQPVCGTYSV